MSLENLIPVRTFTKLFLPFAINYYHGKFTQNKFLLNNKIYIDKFDKIFNYKNKMFLEIQENITEDSIIFSSKLYFNYKINKKNILFIENIKVYEVENYFDLSYELIKNNKLLVQIYDMDPYNEKDNFISKDDRKNECLGYNYVSENKYLLNKMSLDMYQNDFETVLLKNFKYK